MKKTIKALFALMESQRRPLYYSLLLSFLDGFLIVVPIVIAFKTIGALPEFYPETSEPLTREKVIFYTTIMVGSLLVRIVFRYYVLRFRSAAGYETMCEERKKLGKNLRHVSLGYFTQTNLGELVSIITSDAAFIEIEGIGVLEKAAVGIPTFVIGLGILLYLDYRIFFFVLVLFIPAWITYLRFSVIQDKLKINRQAFIGEVTEQTVEFVKGLDVLKTYNMAEKQFDRTKKIFESLRKFSISVEFAHIPPGSLFQFCFRLITAGIVLIAGIFVLRRQLSYSEGFLLIVASFSLFSGMEALGIFSIFSKMTEQSLERIGKIQNLPQMNALSGKEELSNFDVAFDKVTFGYDKQDVLKEVSFCVPEKTTTALVGLSGSGKTTIVHLIARFWDIKKGTITIGKKDVQSISYENLLQNLSFVFQDVFLFQDTILNNIRIGAPKASLEEIQEAAEKAGCHQFIMEMEDGYNTYVGEGGSKLSGGEKQRISIARALVKNAPIVLLDEVTANVDVENERQIQMALQELLKDKTVIVIAHKLSTIQNVDQVLVIEEGIIGQKGKHEELISQKGLYQKLWKIQCETDGWKV